MRDAGLGRNNCGGLFSTAFGVYDFGSGQPDGREACFFLAAKMKGYEYITVSLTKLFRGTGTYGYGLGTAGTLGGVGKDYLLSFCDLDSEILPAPSERTAPNVALLHYFLTVPDCLLVCCRRLSQ